MGWAEAVAGENEQWNVCGRGMPFLAFYRMQYKTTGEYSGMQKSLRKIRFSLKYVHCCQWNKNEHFGIGVQWGEWYERVQ